jgi:hypothetical protein
VHEGRRSQPFQEFGHRANIATHSMAQMLACMDVIMGGVMERFPRLRFAFLEGQCGWLPFWLDRMDEHYEWREPYGEMTHLSMPSSEYFRRQGFCAVECDEEFVARVVAAMICVAELDDLRRFDHLTKDGKHTGRLRNCEHLPAFSARAGGRAEAMIGLSR